MHHQLLVGKVWNFFLPTFLEFSKLNSIDDDKLDILMVLGYGLPSILLYCIESMNLPAFFANIFCDC